MENARRIGRQRGPIYLVVSGPREIAPSEPKDPIAERLRFLASRIRDPRYFNDQMREEKLVVRTLGREILDLVESNPYPLYVSLHNELKSLKGYDPIMYLLVASVLKTVQAEKLRERAEREPVIPGQS